MLGRNDIADKNTQARAGRDSVPARMPGNIQEVAAMSADSVA
jgi:hypothetical protein